MDVFWHIRFRQCNVGNTVWIFVFWIGGIFSIHVRALQLIFEQYSHIKLHVLGTGGI